MPPYIVCIDGIIGAGKSSLLHRLASHYTCFPEPLSEWNLLSSLYADPRLYGLPFQLQVLISQFKQRQQFPDTLVLVERCPWTSRHVFAPLLLLRPDDLDLYVRAYRRLAYPVHHFIYLDVEPQEAFERIRLRSSSPVDDQISLDYLKRLHERYASTLLGRDDVTVLKDADLESLESRCRNLLATKIVSLFPTA